MIHRIFFFLLIVFLPTQLGLHFWPEWSYVLGRRIDFLSSTLFITDILLVGTVMFWLLEYLFMKKSIKGLVLSIWGKSILLNTIYLMLIPLFIYFNILNAASVQLLYIHGLNFLSMCFCLCILSNKTINLFFCLPD